MNEQMEEKLKNLPEAPGIYRMLDKRGNIIYIGKSKCLKKRVHSYFVVSPVWDKARKMAPFIEDIDITVTDTHLEAMVLECESIKTIKPHFNAMMKNDKKYLYLTVEDNYRRKPLKLTYTRESKSFGPFRSQGILLEIAEGFRNFYPIEKSGVKYQFDYHIFPCAMEKEAFEKNQKLLFKLFSSGREMSRFLKAVEQKMKEAAMEERFEQASQFRDFHGRLAWLQKYLSRFEQWRKTDVIYAVPLETGYKFFYIADGLILMKETAPENTEEARRTFAERAIARRRLYKTEQTEKELLDYRDIVYSELADFPDRVYPAEE